MNCRESRRLIGGLDGVPPAQVLAAALDHAAACPRCRARAISLADAALLAAGEELSCAEARRRLPSLVVRPAGVRGPAPERQALQAHLAACEDCRAEQTLLEAMLSVDPARIQLPEHSWDTSFAAQPPPSPLVPSRRRPLAARLAALREALQGLGAGRRRDGDQRQPAWALALLTAMLLMVLARVLLRDPQVQRSLERLLPARTGPRATVDLEALRRAATAAAAGTAGAAATQGDGATRNAPLSSGTATGTEPTRTQTPPPGADTSEADERRRATAPASLGPATPNPGGPPEATTAPSPASTEAPYPPPDPNDDPPPNPYPDPPTASPVEPPVPTLEP